MAGKSGRSINNVPENPVKRMIFSWEGIMVLLFVLVNIFCAWYSEFYNLKSVLRQMPVYLAEIFLMLPMAYILVLGEIDISVGSIVCLSATVSCLVSNTGLPFILVILISLLVGTACGAVNGFILTRFQELPPMIVTLATQIIFRGIAEIVLGEGGSVSLANSEGFKAIGGKVGRDSIHSFPGSDPCRGSSTDPWQKHFRKKSICDRYQPSYSLLFRYPCSEDPYADLHTHGNFLRTVCTVYGILFLWSQYHNRKRF